MTHSRIKKRISNVEQGMSNIEGRNSIEFYGFKRQSVAIPPFYIHVEDHDFSVILYSAVHCSAVLRFAVRPRGVSYEVSGVGRKGERSDNQELDPLEKTLGHKVAEHQLYRKVDKKSALFKNPSFSVPL